MKFNIKAQFTIVIILITISSIQAVTTLPIGNTLLWWLLYSFSIIIFVKEILRRQRFDKSNNGNLLLLLLLEVWYIISIIRGCFIAENYWEWKNLVGTGLTMMLPLVAYLAVNPYFVSLITKQWIRWALPLFFLCLPFIYKGDGTGRYLVPVSIMLLFFPIFSLKWKLIMLGFSLFVFLGNLDARSNLIKFGVPFFMSFGIFFNLYKIKNILIGFWIVMLAFPFVMFYLGVTGIFNIFKMDEYIGNGDNNYVYVQYGEEVNLTADTRTFIYKEVLESAFKYDYYLWGRTPAKGNESEIFGWSNKERLGLETNERFANEVSITNIFTWTGLIGVMFYFFVFAKASYLAIIKSSNQYTRLLGLYLCFRWCYAWVEDFTNFDLSYLYLWIIIGLCYSTEFRLMSDLQVKDWIKGIFMSNKRNYLKR